MKAASKLNILAFSSSRAGSSSYLEMAAPHIQEMLGTKSIKIAFIPYAAVVNDYESYAEMVRKGLNAPHYNIQIAYPESAAEVITEADAIMVGGGNTFKLLHHLYAYKLIELIRGRVKNGVPYIGWSAGANLTGQSICTTNDMPIIHPPSFNSFGLFPFQINPHYINYTIPGHNGETRDQRLTEFMHLNKGLNVVCLPEGTAVISKEGETKYAGNEPGVVFMNEAGKEIQRRHVADGESLNFLLQ